jgi:hypothetical protein
MSYFARISVLGPFEAGDRVTLDRKDFFDFFWHHSPVLLVEKVVPSHSLHLRDLSPGAVRMNVTVIVSVVVLPQAKHCFRHLARVTLCASMDNGASSAHQLYLALPQKGDIWRVLAGLEELVMQMCGERACM